jgi:four helix bundle protein
MAWFWWSSAGTRCAPASCMVVSHYRDLIAWQLAEQFQVEVVRLVRSSPEASKNIRYRDQVINSATSVTANIVEGFLRYSPGDFRRFIDYSLASLGETESRLRDGILLCYFSDPDCAEAFKLARRCLTACIRLKQSQQLFMTRSKGRPW